MPDASCSVAGTSTSTSHGGRWQGGIQQNTLKQTYAKVEVEQNLSLNAWETFESPCEPPCEPPSDFWLCMKLGEPNSAQ